MLTLVIEISQEGDKFKMSAFERTKGIDVTLKHYSESAIKNKEIENLSEEITSLFNKAVRNKESGDNFAEELKKNGRALFDLLFTIEVKKAIKITKANFLLISIDEHLVQIPWELLYDGEEFLCIRFAMGRSVRTKQKVYENKFRDVNTPIKMLVIADPTGDLNSAYEEGIAIRNELDKRRNKVKALSKTGEVYIDFIKRNIRDYDIVHFAGHSEYNSKNPSDSGWILKDGKFTARDIVALGATASMPSIVFSNACQSGRTQEWKVSKDFEDEIYGLANAFLLSGVRHYIGTFWKVLDNTCLDFANEFYKNVTDGLPVGEAVRLARIKQVHKHGYYSIIWSSYMLYGDPVGTLFTKKPQKQMKFYLILAVIFMSMLILWFGITIAINIGPPSFAVFSLDNLDANTKNWDLSHSVASNLSKIPNLNVIDIASLVKLDELNRKSVREISKTFGIKIIAKGQYKSNANKIGITLNLENPISGKIYDTKEFVADDEIDLEDKITHNLVSMLKVRVPEKGDEAFKASSTNNVSAYKFFSKTWELFLGGNYQEAILFCKKALELDPDYTAVYKRLGNIYDAMGDSDSALNSYLEYARLSEKKADLVNLANAFINIGWIYHNKGDYEKAFDLYNKGIIQAVEANDKLYEAKAYRQLAAWYIDKGEYEKALPLLSKSSKINKERANSYNHKYNLACDYQELGILFSYKKDYNAALKYFLKSMKILRSFGAEKQLKWVTERISDQISDNYTNLGDVFFEQKDYDKALKYYNKGLEIDKLIGWQEGLAGDYRSIGTVFAALREFDKAMSYYSKSAEIFSSTKDEVGLAGVYRRMGELHFEKKEYDRALKYLSHTLVVYEKAGFPEVEEIKIRIEEIKQKIQYK